MGYSRNLPTGTGIDPDVVAAIASDPEGYKARKKDLEASITAAQAAIKEATDKHAALDADRQALNNRAAELAALEKQLKGAAEALSVERAAAEAQWTQRRKENDSRSEALRAAEDAQKVRDANSLAVSTETATALRIAEADRDAATLLRAQLTEIATSLAGLPDKLAALKT